MGKSKVTARKKIVFFLKANFSVSFQTLAVKILGIDGKPPDFLNFAQVGGF
ncbi:hypothetical protein D3C71_2223800 [compost metagenome]